VPTERHSEIKDFLERAARGESTSGRELRFDTRTGKFVVVAENDIYADGLPEITPEDLRSFSQVANR
jgi:hypothetical protein